MILKTGNAKRVLFLVDRLELEDQAWKNFVKYLKNDFRCVIYKDNRDDWNKAEIVVSTVQIKGRGTRKYKFKYNQRANGQALTTIAEKKNFKLFDFFANCEYFEEKFKYDEILVLPREGTEGGGDGGTYSVEEFISEMIDPLKTLRETPVGPEGMRIDRELFEKFEYDIKKDNYILENYEKGNLALIEN